MKVLLTGGSGFIGRAVCERLSSESEIELFPIVRSAENSAPGMNCGVVRDISAKTPWQELLSGVDLIIHTAARVHVMNDSAADPMAEFRRINVDGTLNLARQAAEAGVKRFVFLSSIKVNGDNTKPGMAFRADDPPAPADPYGKSKHEAELELQRLSQVSGMEVVVIRPPLVYGPRVRANFLAMMRWIDKGWPVPLGNVDNRRSLVALDNLVDLIRTCCVHPAAANQVLLVSDDEDVSTNELLRRIGVALRKPVRFLPIPSGLVRTLAGFTGKQAQVGRMLGSLQVDIGKTHKLLGWSPVVNMEEALQDTVRHYLDSLG